jgi:hypothetical protein
MKKTKQKKDTSIGNCDVCGKPVYWGKDGTPVVSKGNEMGALFGQWDSVRHSACKKEIYVTKSTEQST